MASTIRAIDTGIRHNRHQIAFDQAMIDAHQAHKIWLRNMAVADAGATIEQFFAQAKVGLLTVSPADFRTAFEAAIGSGR
jgi:hypothetical protein